MEYLYIALLYLVTLGGIYFIVSKLRILGRKNFLHKYQIFLLGLLVGILVTYIAPWLLNKLFTAEQIIHTLGFTPWRYLWIAVLPATSLGTIAGGLFGLHAGMYEREIPWELLAFTGRFIYPLANGFIYATVFFGISKLIVRNHPNTQK
ncbi:MAG: hypothetical protein WCJ29_03135 [bacterium]